MSKFPISQQIAWAERLSMLLHSGVSLREALTLMSETSSAKQAKKMNQEIVERISNGVSLSESIGQIKGVHLLLVRSIHIGEISGSLADMLQHISHSFKRRQTIFQNLVSAAMYPLCILFATVGVAGFLVMYIFPKVMPLFLSMNIPLPLLTRILLWLSGAVSHYWWIGLIASILFPFIFFLLLKKSLFFRLSFERSVLAVPIIGKLIKLYICSHIFHTIETLLLHGASLPDALVETGTSVSFFLYQKAMKITARDIDQGKSCAYSLAENPKLFSADMTGFLMISERAGGFASAAGYISKMCVEEVDRTLATLSKLIEPVLMMFMGIVVGSIALSIILPIYEITNHINH